MSNYGSKRRTEAGECWRKKNKLPNCRSKMKLKKEIPRGIFRLFLVLMWLLLIICGCTTFREISSQLTLQPLNTVPSKAKHLRLTVGTKDHIVEVIKNTAAYYAPWQRIIIKNELHEYVVVEIGMITVDDFWIPPRKKYHWLKSFTFPPKACAYVIAVIPGKYYLAAESHQVTASGEYISGKNIWEFGLKPHYNRNIRFGSLRIKVGYAVKFTEWNLRK